MEIDELKNKWAEIQAPSMSPEQSDNSLIKRIAETNRRIVRNNILGTLSLVATMIFLGFIWSRYPDRSMFFYGSILGIEFLLAITLIFYWRRVLFWKTPDLSLSSIDFLDRTLVRLKRSSFLRKKFMPIYHVILYVSLMLYTFDLVRNASIEWQIGLFAGNTVFLLIVVFVSYKVQSRKHREEIEKIKEEMQKLREGLAN